MAIDPHYRKTQLVIRFAHECKTNLKIFWVRAETFTTFTEDFLKIYSALKPNLRKSAALLDQETLLKRTKTLLENASDTWLLILDNADNFDNFFDTQANSTSIDDCLPAFGRILLTTRDPRFQGGFSSVENSLEVKVMEINDARVLLDKTIPQELRDGAKQETMDRLVQLMGNLPLAIAQAAVNIRNLRVTPDAYVELYKQKRNRVKQLKAPFLDVKATDHRNRIQDVHVTWEISFEFLEQKHPASMTLLNYCSMFHWRGISNTVLKKLPEFENLDELQFRNVVEPLSQSSLVSITDHPSGNFELDLHPITYECINLRISSKNRKFGLEKAAQVLSAEMPPASFGLLTRRFETTDRTFSRSLLPHALSVIEQVSDASLNAIPTVRLMQSAISWLIQLKRKDEAFTVCRPALKSAHRVKPVSDIDVQVIRMQMVWLLWGRRGYKKMLELVTEAFESEASGELEMEQLSPGAADLCDESTLQMFLLIGLRARKSKDLYPVLNSLIVGAQKPGQLRRLKGIQKFALTLQVEKEPKLALTLCDRCMSVYSEVDESALQPCERLDLAFTLSIKARILNISSQRHSDTVLHREEGGQVLALFQWALREYLKADGVRSFDAWSSAYEASKLARKLGQVHAGLQALQDLITPLANDTSVRNLSTGEKEAIGHFMEELFWYGQLLEVLRSRQKGSQLKRIRSSLVTILQRSDLDILDIMADPSTMNSAAIYIMKTGDPAKGEKILTRALALSSESLYFDNRKVWKLIHYNKMLAMLQQPEKLVEAIDFRSKHSKDIEGLEKKHGTLEKYFTRFNEVKRIYDMAKEMRDRSQLSFKDDWWNEHSLELNEAELFYGLPFMEGQNGQCVSTGRETLHVHFPFIFSDEE